MSTPSLEGSGSKPPISHDNFQPDRALINDGTPEKIAGLFQNDQGVEYVGTIPYRIGKEQFPIDFAATKKLPKEMKGTAHEISQLAKNAMRYLPPSPAAPAA